MKHGNMLTVLAAVLTAWSANAAETKTTYRDAQGRTTGSETRRDNADGTTSSAYRDSQGKTTGTATERKNADGSTTKTYRDSKGRTTGSETTRK